MIVPTPPTSSKKPMTPTHSATPISGGVVCCYAHGLAAALKTSRTVNNPNRQFYCCSKSVDRCSFFCWADDVMFYGGEPSSRETPSTSLTPSSNLIQTNLTTPVSPRKRSFRPSSPHTLLTPSQKRMKIMEEAFATPSQPPDRPRATPTSTPNSASIGKRLNDILPPSRQSTAISQRLERSGKAQASDHDVSHVNGLQCSPEQWSLPSAFKPHTLFKGKFTAWREDDDNEDADLRTLMTPPRIFQGIGSTPDGHSDNLGSMIFLSEKEKSDANDERIFWCPDDPENPFDTKEPALTHSGTINSLNPFSTTDKPMDFSADLISTLLNNMSGIPEYVRKLERQKIAAQKSNDAKAKRIIDLEEEVASLKLARKALEETIKTLKAK